MANDSFPKKVVILGKTFIIKYEKLDVDTYGEITSIERVIKINSQKPKHTWRATLLHECIHGILQLSGQSQPLTEETEEGLVVALENGLLDLVDFRRF